MWNELRDAGDAEFVSVEGDDETVSVRRVGDKVHVDVDDHEDGDQVRVEVPVSVVDALFSGEATATRSISRRRSKSCARSAATSCESTTARPRSASGSTRGTDPC